MVVLPTENVHILEFKPKAKYNLLITVKIIPMNY